MKRVARYVLPVSVAISLFCCSDSQAIPAFARREGIGCNVCHFRMAELNAEGRNYLLRGLREEPPGPIGGGEGRAEKETGAPAGTAGSGHDEPLRMAWANYLTVMGHVGLQAHRGERVSVYAGMVEAWIGGPLNEHWSALAVPVFDVEGGTMEVDQAYGQFMMSWGERFGCVRFGGFIPVAVLLHQGGPTLSLTTPVILVTPSGALNSWTPSTSLRGLEIGVMELGRGSLFLGAVQPETESGESSGRTDFYASGDYVIGDEGNAVSCLGYIGSIPSSLGRPSLDFGRIVAFADVYLPRTKGVLGFLWGRDDPEEGPSLDMAGGFLLVEGLLSEKWSAFARYDYLHRESPAEDGRAVDGYAMDGPAAGLSFWAFSQVRITLEAQFLKTAEKSRDRLGVAELNWIF